MLLKCCTQYSSKFGKLNSGQHDWKKSVFIPILKKGNTKECLNYSTIALVSHASRVMLKILQARIQQCVNQELSDIQDGFRKGRGTRDQIANIHWIIETAGEFQKSMYFCFIDYCKTFDCVDNTSSVHFSPSVMSDSLRPHELQHTRPPCPSLTPRDYSSSCPFSW